MILAEGKLYPSEKSGDILAALPAALNATLLLPPPDILVVVEALDRFAARIRGGAYADRLQSLLDTGIITSEQLVDAAALLERKSLLCKLETELGPDFLSAVQRTPPHASRSLTVKRMPLGVLFHIAAGNAEALPAYSVAEGLLMGNVNLLKLPAADDGVSVALLRELLLLEPRLAPYVYVFDTPSSDLDTMKKLAYMADAVVVWGGDEAVQAVRRFAPPSISIIEWGHRLSFAYATTQADDEELAGLARHIFQTNQLYCSSCQGIFVDTADPATLDAFAARFLSFLDQAGREAPPRDIGTQAQITLQQCRIRLESMFSSARILRGACGSVTIGLDHQLELSPMFGNVWIKPLPRTQLVEALRPSRGYLQTAGLLCGKEERGELAWLLCRAGVNRVTYGDDMSRLFCGEAHDGRYPLQLYSRIAQTEI